jgi:hypothetical protein
MEVDAECIMVSSTTQKVWQVSHFFKQMRKRYDIKRIAQGY